MIRWLLGIVFLHVCGLASAHQISDDDGRVLNLPQPATRIVSLSPGATAMLFAAGAGARVIATARYSDEPAAAQKIPRIGDAQSFDIERILALQPDVVVAWASGTPPQTLERLERLGLRVYHHRVTRLDDFAPALRRLGQLAGTSIIADPAAATLASRIETLRLRHAQDSPERVLIQIWDKPLYTIGGAQLLSDIVQACGERNLFDDLDAASAAVSTEAVLTRNPDAILAIAPDAQTAAAWLASWRAFPALSAVQHRRLLAYTDPRLSRLGPETIAAAETLCAQLARPQG